MIDLDKMRADVAWAQKNGWTIKSWVTVDIPTRTCCPIGAGYFRLSTPNWGPDEWPGKSLGISEEESRAFTHGFDGLRADGCTDKDAYDAGCKLAGEYLDR